MAWEIWSDKGGIDSTYGHMGFFCNTVDESFGPVFLTDTYFDKMMFYKMWDMANFADPRLNEGSLWSQTHRVIHLMDYKDNVQATMTVSQGNKVIFTQERKDNWDGINFSPFHPQLEALAEDAFDTVNDLVEDANNDMKVLLIADYNEEEGSTTLTGHYEITVEMKWKVINE
jgi:hypothetical protein